ncbi:NAD-dependent dehydratase [Candidatus Thiomargarita nelsonii]|uniref:NAD-dependent dehydratase n=1 Tax=Candidatus Thiomargarita nelsonii TaxID=1003181 RepID=A0A0A6P800_9GAMM|nr:NAD-dependent dehydratase [Candidatus Thiomargarita nelsonii]
MRTYDLFENKVFVLGGDGFCGWPTSLHLSNHGFEVVILDNLSRRKIDIELGIESLTPIASIQQRIETWQQVSGKKIGYYHIDIAKEYDRFLQILLQEKPSAMVHFAEQRAAPYSMRGSQERRYTVDNNITATHNVLCAILESGLDVHLLHLGTTGVYGYDTHLNNIPEGYLDIEIPQKDAPPITQTILHPMYPGSVYHTTKCLDELLFYFYNKNDKLRITDLHQGVVWGTNTEETKQSDKLINRFDYDGEYGTVLNRFLVQAAIGHPLTVYGTGGQTRAFINIQDTVNCIRLAIENPPSTEKVRIFNQITEVHRLIDLANYVSRITGAEIKFYDNPRKEAASNELPMRHEQLEKLGLTPILLEQGLCEEVSEVAKRYQDRCNLSQILPTTKW